MAIKFDAQPTILPHVALKLISYNIDIKEFSEIVYPVMKHQDVVSQLASLATNGHGIDLVKSFVKRFVESQEYIIQN